MGLCPYVSFKIRGGDPTNHYYISCFGRLHLTNTRIDPCRGVRWATVAADAGDRPDPSEVVWDLLNV